jgi:anti-sigma B factor antagonist
VDIGVETTPIGDARAILIAVDGELDLSTCEQLKPAADEAVFGRRPLILDLSRCTFIDSSGLRLVLQIANGLAECEGAGLSMAIVAGESGTRKMFSLTAIDRKVPLFDSRDEALAWLGEKPKPHHGQEARPVGPHHHGFSLAPRRRVGQARDDSGHARR